MATISSLVGILTALLVGAVSPGPSFVLVSKIAITKSRLHGIKAALGMGVGGAVFACLALFGLGALLQSVSWLDLSLKVLGGSYLLYLAVHTWTNAKGDLEQKSGHPPHVEKPFRTALLTQLSNPKTAVVYATIFAALMPSSEPLRLLPILPPLVFLVEAGWYTFVALCFSAAAPKAIYLRFRAIADRVAGAVMGALGTRLLFEALASRLHRI